MNEEMWQKAHKLLNADIDPIYREIAGILGEEFRKSRYLPWLMARYMTVDLARAVLTLPDPDWRPSLGDLNVSETFARKLGIDKKTLTMAYWLCLRKDLSILPRGALAHLVRS